MKRIYEDILWMFCTQCTQVVIQNDNGICLRCQGSYTEKTQPDSWKNVTETELLESHKEVPRTREHIRNTKTKNGLYYE